jgi:hypothetical protein
MTQDEVTAIVRSPAFQRFHNALRIIRAIDAHELEAVFGGPIEDWPSFRDAPIDFFIQADDATAATIWTVIERRQPPGFVDPLQSAADALAISVENFARALDDARARDCDVTSSAGLADVHSSLAKLADLFDEKSAT